MIITASTYHELTKALQSRGFYFVQDLPRGTKIARRKHMIVARLPC